MKRLWILWMMVLLPYCLSAQNNAKAAEILDRTLINLTEENGIRMDFTGSDNGFILLKRNLFYLNSSQAQSWYDGKTLWSYVADTEEVNISEPAPEELQSINPYYALTTYKVNCNYSYAGIKNKGGKKAHEVILTPKQAENKESIRLLISEKYYPLSLVVEQNGQIISEIQITKCSTNQKLENEMFRFNKTLYPNAEVIDMR